MLKQTNLQETGNIVRLLTNTMMFGKRNRLEGQKASVSFIYTRKYWVSESLCSWLWFNFCATARFIFILIPIINIMSMFYC